MGYFRIVASAFLFLVAVAAAGPGQAAPPDQLLHGGTGPVATIVDGDTVRLKDADADVRLVGIQTPKLPLGRKNFKQWPLADEARAALADLVRGHAVTLRLAPTPKDRNGRVLAHIMRDDGLWVQAEMLRLGWARVYTFPDNRRFAQEMLAAEGEARAAKRGIWSHDYYAVRPTDPTILARDVGTFQIVEGRVVSAAKVRGRVFLNFGDDFKTDVTATIPPDVLPLFTKAGVDPLMLKDKTVRVRGYVRNYNGPSLDLTHPEQLEIGL